MPAPTAATPGRKKPSASPKPVRRKAGSGKRKAPARGRGATRRLWPVVAAAAVVFLIAYIVDTGAVLRLIWACCIGELGLPARIVSLSILVLTACALAWSLRMRPAPPPRPKRAAATPRPRASRSKAKVEAGEAGTGDAGTGEAGVAKAGVAKAEAVASDA